MAKARPIPDLKCSGYAIEGAVTILRVRFDEVLEHRDAALDFSDIKGIHSMRVALRRLRSALRDFKLLFKAGPLKDIKADLKTIADALGAVRDLDVEIAVLEKQADESEENNKEGLARYLEKRNAVREKEREKLEPQLTGERIDRLADDFAAALEKAIYAGPPDQALQFTGFKDFGRTVIANDLNDLIGLIPALYGPFATVELHQLRIAAKRLRYAMQLFADCLDEEFIVFGKEIAKLQTLLGDTHDYDVWIGDLAKRIETEDLNALDRQTAIRLMSDFLEKRNREYIKAVELYTTWKTNYFLARLKALVL